MSDFFKFASDHPFIAWFMVWIIGATISSPFKCAFQAYNRYCRTKNIAAHGWPTRPDMDADGDIVKAED